MGVWCWVASIGPRAVRAISLAVEVTVLGRVIAVLGFTAWGKIVAFAGELGKNWV
jgi:hypothetical protein